MGSNVRPGGRGRPPGRIGRGGLGPASPSGPYRGGGSGGGTTHNGGCCPMVAALRSAKAGQWRKARLYARLGAVSLRGRVIAWAA